MTPAAVRTPIFDQMPQSHIDFMLSKIPMGRFGTVDEIAAVVTWAASEDCGFTTGVGARRLRGTRDLLGGFPGGIVLWLGSRSNLGFCQCLPGFAEAGKRLESGWKVACHFLTWG